MFGRLAIVAIFASAALSGVSRAADDPNTTSAGRLGEMRRLGGELTALRIDQGKRTQVELSPEPLHRWNDPTRDFSDGAVWIWGRGGRPLAAVAMELYPVRDRGALRGVVPSVWSLEMVSLATQKSALEVHGSGRYDLALEGGAPTRPDGTLLWTPEPVGLTFRPLPDAPSPAQNDSERLLQVKRLARRFTATEYLDRNSQTYTLRLMPHPALRYTDAANGVLDGTVFLLVHGTNPEILLLIEAAAPTGGEAHGSWRYAAARLSLAAPTLELDKAVVWTTPSIHHTAATDTYYLPRRLPDVAPPSTPAVKPGRRP